MAEEDRQYEELETSVSETDDAAALLGLSDEQIIAIREALADGNGEALRLFMDDLSYSDKADLLEKIDMQSRHVLLDQFAFLFEPEVFTYLQDEVRKDVLEDMSAAEIARIISDLESDDALDLILPLDEEFRHEIIRKLSAKSRIALEEGFSFPEESAGRLMQREFVAVPQFWTVGKTLDYLRAAGDDLPDDFYVIIIIDPSYHVVGEIPLHRLIRSRRSEKIDSLTLDDNHPIPATMDQEEVAQIFRNEGLASAPVVDDDGRLIGIITYDDVIEVIDEEAEEDILKMGGVGEGDLYRNILETTGSRFQWLFVNLGTAILAAFVISLFEATIEKIVALAILMPIVASMGGNAGTQALTVAVRALATKELSGANAWRVIGKEVGVGFLNGALFAILIGSIAGFWFQDHELGLVIGTAMIVNMIVAGFCGASIPIFLNKIDIDPAVASSVFLTTMTDVIGFFAFLGLATAVLL